VGAASVILVLTAFVVIVAIARSWPRAIDRASAPPPPQPRGGGPRTHYRTLEPSDAEPESGDVARFVDPALPLDDRRALLELLRAHGRALPLRDGGAMMDAAERALSLARTAAVRAQAMRVLAHGQALSGDARAAVSTLDALPAGVADDLALEVEVLRRARRYHRALELLRLMAIEGDGERAASLMESVSTEATDWDRAVALLDGAAPPPAAEDYALVRDAGRLKGRNQDAARVGERMFEAAADPDLAWAIAGCWVRARDPERALQWAMRAADAGSRDLERLDAPDLAPLHAAPADALARLRAALQGDSRSE
jgi:TPR repeat protein